MFRDRHSTLLAALLISLLAAGAAFAEPPVGRCGGALEIVDEGGTLAGVCPLKHTDVRAEIVGFVGRVHVRQAFHNPTDRKIEAVYVFPLPQDAAVDDMVMTVGGRRIVGEIKERDEARAIYEAARVAGNVAGLLDQERPNVFTQSVANIEPGVEVTIEISYVETLKYEDGVFEWVFPMVVGPRYVPGGGSAPAPLTTGRPTPQVPDADRITPPVTPKNTRAGHDVSLRVTLEGGTFGQEPHDVESVLHEIDVAPAAARNRVMVSLRNQAEIPNRDFVLRYRLGGEEIGDVLLVQSDARGTYFTLALQPPTRVQPAAVVARELVFVLDTSGSMSGLPIETAKKVISGLMDTMRGGDTFNVITFSGDTHVLWPQPRPNTPENRAAAEAFLTSRSGGGGTEMMKAIEAALGPTAASRGARDVVRVAIFLTDGYVGNDFEIIDAVRRNADATRVFSFGIGNAVNRFLLDGVAHAGRGAVEYVTLFGGGEAESDELSRAEASAARFHERVLAPVLTDVQIDWGTLPVADVFPRRIPDLFASTPIMVHGRLTSRAEGTITIRGNTGAGPFVHEREVSTGPVASAEDARAPSQAGPGAAPPPAAALWARAFVADLMNRDLRSLQGGEFPAELKQQITQLGLDYRLLTQFTSFVAVEEMTVTVAGEPTLIRVPVEMPEGVRHEGVFGGARFGFQLGFKRSAGLPLRAIAQASPAESAPLSGRSRAGSGEPVRGARLRVDADADGDGAGASAPPTPEAKLAEALRELGTRVEKDGRDGTLTIGRLRVVDWKVDVIVALRDASQATREALAAAGFLQTAESRAARLLVGTIDVRRLCDLAKVEAVVSIRPAAP